MRDDFEPALTPIAIDALRPTQMTVGLREVERKRKEWRKRRRDEGPEFLGRHMIPVVIGPKQRPWLVDHHHLAFALQAEGERHVLTSVIADLSRLGRSEFWTVMDNRGWLHPFDAQGKRRDYAKLPESVADLADDPFRSLAGELRRQGGYAKSGTPYTEFLWADFLRRRIDHEVVRDDFAKAARRALELARTREADHLPGWVESLQKGAK